jgi:sensor c-di-GMP phosphodiesterase-like protein
LRFKCLGHIRYFQPVVRRDKLLWRVSVAALGGVLVLFGAVGWYIWNESVTAEEQRLGLMARRLGENVEQSIVEARDLLDRLNKLAAEPCSTPHLTAMQNASIATPHIRAIGYWQAAERLCGLGMVRGAELMPPRADRIYESGVIAWWPGEQTEVGGVQLFLMRYGAHDVAIDPRLLLDTGIVEDLKAGLWVEGLLMASQPGNADLPSPDSIQPGLTVDQVNNRVISRFSLGTILQIDIVAAEPIASFRDRYLPIVATPAGLGLLLIALWIYLLFRYSRRQLSLGAELRDAISDGRLLVKYQPIVELVGGRCIGAEALVRWRQESGDVVSPDVFIPVAEKEGLLPRITRSVLHSIVTDMGELLRKDTDLCINLNVAGQDLEGGELLQALEDKLDAAGVSPSSIKLEITERALVNSDAARELIHQLRRRGHRVAIDDFGTGYSSLSYLQAFEIDTLKIDKVFVDAVETDADTSQVTTHVIEMAHALELDIVAEGVENVHQAEWLQAQGVTHAQGFFYSKPLSARGFLRYYCKKAHKARSNE